MINRIIKNITTIILAVFVFSSINGQDVVGKWRHYDEETHLINTIVETYIKNDSLFAKIVVVYNYDKPDTLKCTNCPGTWNNKNIVGLNVINGITKKDDYWEGDQALIDPETQEVYDCRIWFQDGNLKVRGYVGFLYQTIDWYPLESTSQIKQGK